MIRGLSPPALAPWPFAGCPPAAPHLSSQGLLLMLFGCSGRGSPLSAQLAGGDPTQTKSLIHQTLW